jgi:hypothetical protein
VPGGKGKVIYFTFWARAPESGEGGGVKVK